MQEQVIKVFHKDLQAGTLTHVANVKNTKYDGQHEALEYAWVCTQNICGSWSKGPQVSRNGHVFENEDYSPDVEVVAELPMIGGSPVGLRSSMTGDIFEIEGAKFKAVSFGFEPASFSDLEVKKLPLNAEGYYA